MSEGAWTGHCRLIPRSTGPTSTARTFPAPQGDPSNYMNLRDEPADHAIGRSRGGLSTKIHALVDGKGRPLVLLVAPGQGGDAPMFPHLMNHLKVNQPGPGRPRTRPDRMRGDKAYSSRAIRSLLRRRRITAVIPEPADQIGHRKRRGPPAAGLRPSTGTTTRAATSSNGTSTPSSNGVPWPPATTSSRSRTAAVLSSGQSASGWPL
jgi:transposase